MLITVDFETHYSKEYNLNSCTTEEYIRDPRFEVIGVCVKVDDGPVEWFSGDFSATLKFLRRFDWENALCLSHNAMFDAAILSWRFAIRPKLLLDTLSMSRAWNGLDQRHSLAALAEQFGIGEKGTEVYNMRGFRRTQIQPMQMARYAQYCKKDAELCYELFNLFMQQGFPHQELKLIDRTLRMFTEPVLSLDVDHLKGHLRATQRHKINLMADAGINDKKDLMSNNKFAELLRAHGVEPPKKISPTTGKETYAFAKTDEAMRELADHDDPDVQALVAARLGNKSTLEETRTERFISMGERGPFPVPLRYCAAKTHRWGGQDLVNLQNLPSRGPNAKKIKQSIVAPEGHVLVDADSSQIEARVLAWLAGQHDLVKAFANKEDVYVKMASRIYGVNEDQVDSTMRFIGKTTILGCFAGDTRVLTNRGWVFIPEVKVTDLLWDGEEWVTHKGVVPQGEKTTIRSNGVAATPDHEILTEHGWVVWQEVLTNPSHFQSALDKGSLKLPAGAEKNPAGGTLLCDAHAVGKAWLIATTLGLRKQQDATAVQRRLRLESSGRNITALYPILSIVQDYLTASLRVLHAAIQKLLRTTSTTALGVFSYAMNGERTAQRFYVTRKRYPVGTTPNTKWTVSTTTTAIDREILGSSLGAKTWPTVDLSEGCKQRLMTYDIAYAGPRNRYTVATDAGPIIVHNCGYGMGAPKFQLQLANMGTEVSEDEARRIIRIYRDANDKIVGLWREAQRAVVAMQQKAHCTIGRGGVVEVDPYTPRIIMPSGLSIFYRGLIAQESADGRREYVYKDRNGYVRLYGGKIVENLCQSLARIIVAEQLLRISRRYRVVLTVHDSVVACVKEEEQHEAVAYIEKCMRWVPSWAEGLPVDCEVDVSERYGG